MSDKETPSKGNLLNKHLQSKKQVKKKDKDLFKFAFSFHTFAEIPNILETHTRKKINFPHYHQTKLSRIILFWLSRESKMLQNIVFRINREN